MLQTGSLKSLSPELHLCSPRVSNDLGTPFASPNTSWIWKHSNEATKDCQQQLTWPTMYTGIMSLRFLSMFCIISRCYVCGAFWLCNTLSVWNWWIPYSSNAIDAEINVYCTSSHKNFYIFDCIFFHRLNLLSFQCLGFSDFECFADFLFFFFFRMLICFALL